jgi:hypothetical protein
MKLDRTVLLVTSSLMFSVPVAARAQSSAADDPAMVIRIFREEVKPGRAAAHERNESAWVQAFAKGSYRAHYLGLTSMTGAPEAWFIEPHDSFASIEKADKEVEKNAGLAAELEALSARDGEMLSTFRGLIARYREDLSYRASPVGIAKTRYVGVGLERVKPGYRRDYEDSTRLDVAAYTKAGISNERWIAYQVIAGTAGLYLYFTPMASLAEGDIDNQKTYDDAMGERGRARQIEINRQAILSSEFQVFAVSPKMSYLPKEVTGVDPDFWTPKPAGAKPAANKADKPKP